MFELCLAAHNVIKGFLLPERTFSIQCYVDVMGAPTFPVTDDFTKRVGFKRFDQCMEMIGHDAPGVEAVGLAMAGRQSCGQDVGAYRFCQVAFAAAGIEKFMKTGGKITVVFVTISLGELVEGVCSLKAMRKQPGIPFATPFDCHCRRH